VQSKEQQVSSWSGPDAKRTGIHPLFAALPVTFIFVVGTGTLLDFYHRVGNWAINSCVRNHDLNRSAREGSGPGYSEPWALEQHA
jgi:hypothetical protein